MRVCVCVDGVLGGAGRRMAVAEEHTLAVLPRSCKFMWKPQILKRQEHSVKCNLFYPVF